MAGGDGYLAWHSARRTPYPSLMSNPRPRPVFAAFVLALALVVAVPAHPVAQGTGTTIERLESYLSGIRSIESDFVQSSSKGGFARGRLYVQRPNGLRLDYRPPSSLQIYVSGSWLIYVDTELEEVTHIPIDRTPAAFLVGETVSFSGAVRVVGMKQDRETVMIELVRAEEPESGSAILTFGRGPLALKGWTVIDAQGVRTRVALVRPKFNGTIDSDVFHFDPDTVIRPAHDP